MSSEPYITPPRDADMGDFPVVDRWRQRVTELINQISDGIDVSIQDQTTPTVIVPLNQVTNTTTLLNDVVFDGTSRDIDVTDTTGFIDGAFVVIASIDDNRYYVGYQIGAVAGNTVTLDTPVDFMYTAGIQVTAGTTELSVDGSVTPQIFSLRASDPGLPVEVDITRIIFVCTTTASVDLTKFGDIVGGLTNGIVLRRTDGTFANIFNAKTNQDLASLMYDFQVAAATNPAQGQDGFTSRLTFGGQSKMGVVIRVGADEDLELLVQDDLSSLLSFKIVSEGHVVDP